METLVSQFTAEEISGHTLGRIASGSGRRSFGGISIDTRTLRTGELFFAIRGPHHDGHTFISKALSKGAAGIVVESGYSHPGDFPSERILIRVEDTHQALKDLAAAVRRRWRGTAVGITGSMGKTTTKEFTAQMLQEAGSVFKSPGNYNNLYGLPLALMGLTANSEFGIFEMGMSAPGEIAEMCRIAEPVIGILTNIAPVHMQFFGSLQEIADAKGELAEALPTTGTLVYNRDNVLIRTVAARCVSRKISFGLSEDADFRADRIEIIASGQTRFRIRYSGRETVLTIPLAGAHYVMNTLPAVVLGHLHGLTPECITRTLQNLQPASMRGQILRFEKGFTVMDDSYNSNPEALKSMIEVLAQTPSFQRRILVAGEMLELGPASESLHYDCGAFAAKAGLDGIIGVRGTSREIVRAARENGMRDMQARFFEDTGEAYAYLKNEVRLGDLILIKGSRGVRMDGIVQSFCSDFERS